MEKKEAEMAVRAEADPKILLISEKLERVLDCVNGTSAKRKVIIEKAQDISDLAGLLETINSGAAPYFRRILSQDYSKLGSSRIREFHLNVSLVKQQADINEQRIQNYLDNSIADTDAQRFEDG